MRRKRPEGRKFSVNPASGLFQGLETPDQGGNPHLKYQSAIRRAFVLFVRDGGCWKYFLHNSCLRRETVISSDRPNRLSAVTHPAPVRTRMSGRPNVPAKLSRRGNPPLLE